MEDLLQSQIKESCRLAMPDGLRELMCDISREVLRAQPPDLYNFIVNYLEALLLARDTLTVACQVCGEVCDCSCQPELDKELRNLGLDGDDLETAKNVVMEHFDKNEVNEGNLIMKLFNNTNIDVNLLEGIQEAVQVAFLKNQRHRQAKLKEEAEKANAIGQKAAKQTLRFYERAQVEHEESEDAKDAAALKIQATFHKRQIRGMSLDEDALKLKRQGSSHEGQSDMSLPKIVIHQPQYQPSTSKPGRNHTGRLSSTSLAGSLINLPKFFPYSVHEMNYEDFEERETEHNTIDYTLEIHSRDSKKEERKKIIFHEQHVLHEIESCSIEEESDAVEEITEDIQNITNFSEDNANGHEEHVRNKSLLANETSNENTKERVGNLMQKFMDSELVEEKQIEDAIDKHSNGKLSSIEDVLQESVTKREEQIEIIFDTHEDLPQTKTLTNHREIEDGLENTFFDDQVNEQESPYDKSIDDDNIDEESLQEENFIQKSIKNGGDLIKTAEVIKTKNFSLQELVEQDSD